jgi:hypothetical protein
MTEKKLKAVIRKIVKKVIKKEISKLKQEDLLIAPAQINHQLTATLETWESGKDINSKSEDTDDPYTKIILDIELEQKLRELKFRQELRKDWILFIVKDVVVFAATVIFMFAAAGYYVFTLINN